MKYFMFLLILAVSVAVIQGESPQCLQPIEPGPCLGYFKRYAYSREGGCKEFIFGGCQANENNFLTAEDCHRACLIPR